MQQTLEILTNMAVVACRNLCSKQLNIQHSWWHTIYLNLCQDFSHRHWVQTKLTTLWKQSAFFFRWKKHIKNKLTNHKTIQIRQMTCNIRKITNPEKWYYKIETVKYHCCPGLVIYGYNYKNIFYYIIQIYSNPALSAWFPSADWISRSLKKS
jgi:hypothetical protein